MIPTMVSMPERQTLKEFIALNYEGVGEVVEIGAFCGASAVAIMQGIRSSGHKRKLYVYDTFQFPTNDLEAVYRKIIPRVQGQNFRAEFDFQTREWRDDMIVIQADASKQGWTRLPIEFLHIDCSISREFHEAVALEFYPHLVEGGVLVHQDFDYERAPFIAEIMDSLGDAFKPIAHIETTKYFSCRKKLSKEQIAEALRSRLKAAA